MKSKITTKHALFSSVMSLFLCVAMLIGSTFAWFTDTASTSVNSITAGNLHVEIQDKNGNSIDTLEWVKDDGTVIDNQEGILWEPGCTYLLTPFKIVNTGNLALKYKIVITGLDGDSPLLNVIKFTYKNESGEGFDMSAEGHLTAKGTVGAETALITVSAHMDELAGNEYQDKTLTGVKFTVYATQDTVEYDSEKNTYDESAEYPKAVNTQGTLDDAIKNTSSEEKTTLALPSGSFNLTNGVAKGKDVTIMGTKDTVIDICQNLNGESGVNSGMNYQDDANLAFEGVTILGQSSGNYGGIVRATTTFKDCTINGKLTLYGNATFIDCTFVNADDYAIWTWGAKNVTFESCTFESGGKAINLYGGSSVAGTPTTTMSVNNCVFNDSNNGAKGKAAIETGNDYGSSYVLTVNNITVNGFAINSEGTSTNSKIWANKKSMSAENLTVIIDGVKVQ